jgi:8-oxo-dGTP diphosphatase
VKLATLCYLRDQGRTLMVHRTKKQNDIHQGKWNESGLEVSSLVLKGLLTFPKFANDEDWYAFVFIAGNPEGSLIESPEGQLEWIDDESLKDLELWEGDRIFFPWLDQAGFFSGKFVYENGKLVEHSVEFYD